MVIKCRFDLISHLTSVPACLDCVLNRTLVNALMSFFGFEQQDIEAEKRRFLEQSSRDVQPEDVAVYTWGEDSYDGLGDALQEAGDDQNDETFGVAEVGECLYGLRYVTPLRDYRDPLRPRIINDMQERTLISLVLPSFRREILTSPGLLRPGILNKMRRMFRRSFSSKSDSPRRFLRRTTRV